MHEAVIVLGKILVVLALVALNGFFVCAEFAIVKVRSSQVQTLIQRGHRRARLADNLIRHLDAYLSATQLGITIASLGLGWVGEPFVARLLEPVLHAVGITHPHLLHPLAFGIGFSLITFLHIVLGELAPKSIAIRKPLGATLFSTYPLVAFYWVMYPAIWSLNHAANWFLRLCGISPASETEMAYTQEELRLVLARGPVSDFGRQVSLRALELHKRTAQQIMRPRTQIVYLSTRRSLADNVAIARQSRYSQFPLCDGDLDNVIGWVHVKDLLALLNAPADKADLRSVKRDLPFVPAITPVEKLFHLLRARRAKLAILVDEFGGTVGMVTMHDILDEIVGPAADEEEPRWVQIGDNEYRVDAALPLHELAAGVGAVFEANVATLGGYILSKTGSVPKPGDRVDLGDWEATILKADRRRIHQVSLKRKSPTH